ncbi:mucin-17-like [Polistes fuscatus]|uniref:mucin-17-like n=1 Tax=Polistes fuscatus TaxID=30207 RepID=UPI001CA8E387|nr:mucin-17-like [Polistes fuscatus]
MERRLSWCTIAILFVLLFVTSEALRGHSSQVEEQRSQTFGSRGTARFDGKSIDKFETTSAASSLRSRSNRERKAETRRASNNDRQVSRNSDNVKESFGSRDRSVADKKINPEQSTNLADSRTRSSKRNERRYLPEQSHKQISRRIDQEATLEAPRQRKENNASRRVSSKVESVKKGNDQQLNVNTGPSVFSGTTENSRSRTGRKIHTTYTDKELKKELPVSRRFNSESSTNSTRRNSSSRGSRKDSERGGKTTEDSIQLTESESIRVDIPLILATTDYPKLTTAINDAAENQYSSSRSSSRNADRRSDDREYSRSNIKESRNSDRTKSRRKSNDELGTSNSRSVQSRRGSSKFVDFTTPETIETTVTTRSKNRNSGRSSDRSRNSANESGKSRTRDRSLDIVSRSISSNGVSGQAEIKRRSSGDRNFRNPEIRSRSVDTVQDQDNRGRSRGRIRAETTTPKLIDFPTAIPMEMTTGTLEYTTLPVPEVPISTTRSTGQRESGRTITEGSSRVRSRIRAVSQGGRNTTKEDFFNHGLGFRGRKFPTDEITSSPNKPVKMSPTQVRGNPGWTLRRRPGHLDKIESSSSSTTVKEQTNEIISGYDRSINKESTTIVPTTRRGSKKLNIDESTSTMASTTKNQNPRRGSKNVEQVNPAKDSEESDNYPPDFKARLSQLKNSNLKIPVTKSTPRTSTEGKKSSSALFSERSRMKLELARRLVKPELNEQENVLDLTGKSRTTDMSIAEETKKVDKLAKVSKTSRADDQRKLEKLSRGRQDQFEENSDHESRASRQKKGRVISERTVTSISVDEDTPNYVVETVTKVTEEVSSTMIDGTLLKNSSTRKSKTQDLSSITSKPVKGFNSTPRSAIKEFKSNNFIARRNKSLERDSTNGLTDVIEDTSKIKSNKQQSFSTIENEENQTKKPRMLNSVTKVNFQTRYPKKLIKDKIVEEINEIPQQTTSRTSLVTSRYSRKKVDILKPFDPIPKTITTVTSTSSKRREFRPRTATYRRHSEVPTTSVQSTNKVDSTSGVAITPKTPKYHATLKSSTPTTRSIPQEPQVSVRISNDTNSIESGITDSSNGNTGSSNIFNPTRSAFLSGNNTLLEQLRSTVAPLLSSLGNKTPIFAESYSNVNNGSSTPRITPNGSPPRFSARYKGAELFVRKSTGYQATVPSITSSSTTQITPIENIGSALPPPIDISSPGEPKFLTYYQALESASVQNEQGNSQQQRLNDTVTQVDSNNATNGTNGNANSNNDTTSPTNVEIASPQTPNTTNTQPDNLSNENLNQDMENPTVTTEGLPESLNISTTVEPIGSMSTIPDSMIETNTTTDELSTSVAVVEEMSTTQDSPISTDPVDTSSFTNDLMDTLSSTPTMEPTSTTVTSMNDVLTTTVTQSSNSVETMSSSTDVASTTESITIESRLVDLPETTEVTNNMDTIPTTSATQNVENSSASSDITTIVPTESTTSQASSVVSTTSPIETSTESIESNTIEQSDVTSSSSESNDFTSTIRTTTDLPIVTTFRTRLIDFAQDILSRLQSSIGLTTLPPTLTTTPDATTEIPISTSDVDTNIISNNPVENSTIVQQQETTTISDDITSVSMDASIQEAVGFNDSETNTLDNVETSSTTDSSTTANAESSDLTLDIELLTQPVSSISLENESSVNITPESPINSTEMTTFLPTTLQDSTLESTITDAPNDTLLTELMTIAKSLFSEAMNETSVQTRLDNISNTINLETNVENIESSLTTDSSTTMINIDNGSLNDSTTENVPEFSTEVPSEQVETTTISSEREEVTTLAIDLSENEIESTPLSPTTITNTEIVDDSLALNVTQNEVEFIQTNDTSFELGTTLENVEITTTTEPIENEIGIVPNEEFENITESSLEITQDEETTTVSTADLESTTLSYDFQSTTTQTQTTTPVGSIDISVSSTPSMVAESLTTTTVVNDDELSTRNPLNTDTEIPTSTTETTLSSANIEFLTQSTVINDRSSTNFVSTEPMSTAAITEPTTTTEIVTNNDDISTSQAPEIIITETITEQALDESIESNRTNQTIEMTSTELVVNDAEVTTNPPLLTTDTDLLNLTNITGTITTNRPIETTTTIILTDPSLPPLDFMNTTPTDIDRLQDATPATAQGTAASGTMQFDQMNETTIIPSTIITESPTTTTSDSSNSLITESSPSASSTTTDRPSETTTAIETTTSVMQPTEDNIDINDNLISTEASMSISTMPASATLPPDISNSISGMDTDVETTTMDLTAETTSTPASSSSAATTTTTAPSTTSQTIPSMPEFSSESPATTQTTFTSPYMGRFGGSRLTPAPRFSPSSSTRVPLRDYHVYGIYPNKTIVRKRPEDNLIDARNVDSPYVIFGIYPDGRLVRKFPNGTIIPDPPSNPVEVVFSLSTTTTTNRPPPVFFYNQANQGTFNQYQAPSYYNNRRPVANLMTNAQNFGTVDLGLTGNAISGSNGGGADFLGPLGTPGSLATTNTMVSLSHIFKFVHHKSGSGRNGINGAGRIFQDRQRDEGSRSRESAGQRNSVYIGQDRFVNYWTNGAPSTNPRVVSVNINSVASAASEGPASSSRIPSFDNLLNGQSNGDQVTAPPGFPWRDPLDQIFGITTNSPVITASIASNTLDDSNESNPVFDTRPVGPFVEVFTPASGIVSSSFTTEMPTSTTTTVATTPAPTTTTTTTTPAPTTTTTTTTPAPTTTTTTTTTPAPTTTTTTTTPAPTTTTTTTTTPSPTTTTTTTTTTITPVPTIITTTTTPAPTTTTTTTTPAPTTVTLQATTPLNMRTQNAFGTTFDDLAFLNSLLQPNGGPTTQKTLNDVEKLLADKILSLALNNAGPTRSPKAIQFANASPNSIQVSPLPQASSSAPIIIDLLPSSTTKASTISSSTSKPVTTTPTIIEKPIKISDLAASAQTHSASVSSSTTKSPIIVTAKSIPSKPKTTTSAPVQGIGASLLQALFGGNFFGPSTTVKPVKTTTKPIKTTPRIVEITQRPVVTTQSSITPRMVNISEIIIDTTKPTTSTTSTTTTVKPVTTTTQVLLNNPNPRLPNVISSTYSPEDDAKFLSALFNSLQQSNKKNQKPGTPAPTSALDDEAFLRAILSGQAKVPLITTTRSPEINNAALLAALLKAQGIEPSTPATNLREQLQLASLEKNLVSLPPSTSTSRPTTTRPTSTTGRPSTSRPRPQTTTWSPSSTYPPPLFSGFANFVNPLQNAQNNNGVGGEGARNQVVNVALGATRAFSQFLGAAITGAAQQLQSFVRNGTKIVSEAVG